MTTMTLNDASESLRESMRMMNADFIERTQEVTGMMLALVAGEHVFLGGPPGTAKSRLIETVARASGASVFQRLLMRQTDPSELFGPTDVLGLREGRFERRIEGFLPTAEFAYLDECFKANSAVLNGLLTAMNERVYDHGTKRIRIPLRMLAGASNELPEDDSLAALWDRFLLRFWVSPITDEDRWSGLVFETDSEPGEDVAINEKALAAAQSYVAAVGIGKDVVEAVIEIRSQLALQHGLESSDRRWRKIAKLIRAHAVLMGRMTATPADLRVLNWSLWDRPEDIPAIAGVVAAHGNPKLAAAQRLWESAREKMQAVDLRKAPVQDLANLSQGLKLVLGEAASQLAAFDMEDEDADRLVDEIRQWSRSVLVQSKRMLKMATRS